MPSIEISQSAVFAAKQLPQPITGHLALAFGELFHHLKLDSSGQWGNAYFRCDCQQARDCEGTEDWSTFSQASCFDCGDDLTLEHLRISEGWLENA